jgi:hypothetical protein
MTTLDADPRHAPQRLGSLERFLLLYVLRHKKRRRDYVARWAAIQAYAGAHGVGDLKHDKSAGEYKSLQVRVTRALNRLEVKGLAQHIRVGTGLVVDDARNSIPVEEYDPLAAVLGTRSGGRYMGLKSPVAFKPEWSQVHGWSARNRTAYRLTRAGWDIALALNKKRDAKS